jgi:hypothetical protein
VTGKITKWTEKDSFYGLINENTKEPIRMIRKRAMVFSNGMMVEYIKAIGRMENSMERVSFLPGKRVLGKKASGAMGKD